MLEFIVGRAGTGKTHACLQAMKENMMKSPLGPALILLLPEHRTYRVERELATWMREAGSGYVRGMVFGFRRFARQVLLQTGGAVHPRITEIGKRLLLKSILDKREKELRAFHRAAKQRGFTESLARAIEEFKGYRISPAALEDAAMGMRDEHLRGKLLDLAQIYRDFGESMQGRYNDAEDMLDALAKRLPGAAMLRGAEVWVDGFIFFNPQEKAVLRALLQTAAHVHITLAMDAVPSGENRREAGAFHRAWRTMQEMKAIASDLGIACQTRGLGEKWRFLRDELRVVAENLLFSHWRTAGSIAKGGVRIVEAATRRLEAEAVAADIRRLCREEGYRWRDIGVLVRDERASMSALEFVFQDERIPYFCDGKRASVHHPLAELVRSAFEAVRGWRYGAVFRCIRTGFFPITRGQADVLENYVLQFGIQGKRWTMEEDWGYRRRRALAGEEQPAEEERLALEEINQIRRHVSAPLMAFAHRLEDAGDVRAITWALYDFLVGLSVPQTLAQWSEQAEQEGRLAEAGEHRQVWKNIMELLDQLVETSGDERMAVREYEGILGDGLDALEIRLIPPGLDYVTIADFDQNSLDNAKAIYIVGANEGVMPRRSREKGLLSDADRLHLHEAGLELSPGSLEGSFGEKYLLYRGFAASREYLWVSYALADAEGAGLGISPLVGRLREILPDAEFLSVPLECLDRQDAMLLAEERQAVAGLSSALRVYREKHRLAPFWRDVYNWARQREDMRPLLSIVVRGLFARAEQEPLPPRIARQLFARRRRVQGSATRFEQFRACPFQHFAQYGLALRERMEYRFRAPDLGQLLHEALREFGETLKAEKRRWGDLSPEECHDLCSAIITQIAPKLQNEILLSTAQYQRILQRIRETAERTVRRLAAFDASSAFHPAAFERNFGLGPNAMPPLVYDLGDGDALCITGQIDRIDLDEKGKYFLIMDYKTGNAYINLLEVYHGLRLQLLIYLLVARELLARTEGRPMLPAAMLYCFLKNPVFVSSHKITSSEAEKELARQMRMPGWVLADPEVIRAIDRSLSFIKVTLKKDGSVSALTRSNVKTEEEFGILLDYLSCILVDTGRDILAGKIAARPYRMGDRMPCTYCAYRAVCGFDAQVPGFAYEKIAKREDDELMDAMELEVKARQEAGGNALHAQRP